MQRDNFWSNAGLLRKLLVVIHYYSKNCSDKYWIIPEISQSIQCYYKRNKRQ